MGYYCEGGSNAPTGKCDAGHFCPKGQASKNFATVYEFGDALGGQCPKGYYCE